MPSLTIFRFFFTLLSWLVLGAAIYLLWRWWDGSALIDDGGNVIHLREEWVLIAGLALAAWSLLGRFVWRLVLASGDSEKVPAKHGPGTMLAGTDGAKLFVERAGAPGGPTIVLTHGAGNDSTVWYRAKRDLGGQFGLLLWDLPGLGKSKGKVDLESYAENLRVVVRSVGGPVVVVGHSMGGIVIQTLTRRHPEMFGEVIVGAALVNTTYTNPLKTMILAPLALALRPLLEVAHYLQIGLLPISWLSSWQSYLSGSTHMANRLGFGKGVTRSQVDHVSLLSARNSPASQALGNLAMFRWDATGAVAKLADPLLIRAGDGDIVTKPEASLQIAEFTVAPELHIISGSNHFSFLDHATEYNGRIGDYATKAFPAARC